MNGKKIDLLVRGAFLITMDSEKRIIPDAALAVDGVTILKIGPTRQLDDLYAPAKTIDAHGKFLFPGMVTTHTHLFQTLLKGLGRDKSLFE